MIISASAFDPPAEGVPQTTGLLSGSEAWGCPTPVGGAGISGDLESLLVVVAAFLVVLLLLMLFARRLPAGDLPRCGRCGHDLRGIDREGRCPECGADLPRHLIRTRLGPRGTSLRFRLRPLAGRLLLVGAIGLPVLVLVHPGRYPLTPAFWFGTVDAWVASLLPEPLASPYYQSLRNRGLADKLPDPTLRRVATSILVRSNPESGWWGGSLGSEIVGAAWSSGLIPLESLVVDGPLEVELSREPTWNVGSELVLDGGLEAVWWMDGVERWERPLADRLLLENEIVAARVGDVAADGGDVERIVVGPVNRLPLRIVPIDRPTFERGAQEGSLEVETRLVHLPDEGTRRNLWIRRRILDLSSTLGALIPAVEPNDRACARLATALQANSRIELRDRAGARAILVLDGGDEDLLQLGQVDIFMIFGGVADSGTVEASVAWYPWTMPLPSRRSEARVTLPEFVRDGESVFGLQDRFRVVIRTGIPAPEPEGSTASRVDRNYDGRWDLTERLLREQELFTQGKAPPLPPILLDCRIELDLPLHILEAFPTP